MQHAKTMLRRKGLSLQDVVIVLQEFRRNVGLGYDEDATDAEREEEEEEDAEAASRKVILTALIEFLQGSI